MKHFISIQDYSKEELLALLQLAKDLKRDLANDIAQPFLEGKILGMIFEKPSTRTRVSFSVGMTQLGGHSMYLSGADIGMGDREPVADVARVMSRYVDAVLIRNNSHEQLVEYAKFSSVPLINGLSDLEHPCQAMADALTIWEHRGTFDDVRVCYVGDANNVFHSLAMICNKLGMEIVIAAPEGFEPQYEGIDYELIRDPKEAVKGADVVYTDVWTSMGQEEEREARLKAFSDYQVTDALMQLAKPDAIFMHCLPAHRGEEVDEHVVDGPASVVFDQAENRLHAQKSILYASIQNRGAS